MSCTQHRELRRGDTHRQKRGGAAEEGLLPGGVHQRVLLALLDGGARESDVAGKFFRGQRLARQRGLVDLVRSRGQGTQSDGLLLLASSVCKHAFEDCKLTLLPIDTGNMYIMQ
jgi:hypothetical protein